jgi:hypothetical protein
MKAVVVRTCLVLAVFDGYAFRRDDDLRGVVRVALRGDERAHAE